MTTSPLDILICIVPKINPDAPTVGPAILKSHLMAAGFTCEVMDLNVKLFNALKKHDTHNEHYFEDDMLFITHHTFTELNEDFQRFCEKYHYVFMEWIDIFRLKNPKWIGLSILSIFSMSMTVKLSQLIREHLPHIKIVWGGPQIVQNIEPFKEKGLMDHYICGDAEFSLIELLNGNTSAKGIDSLVPNQVDLDLVMPPNYDDICWDEYNKMWGLDSTIYITGSRGCVKRCTFCNIYKIWPEYRFRSGKDIAAELIMLKHKYNRRDFKFTDSLINGSMKTFRETMNELIEYRKTDNDFTWFSQWIVRPKNQSPEEDFRLMKESGCTDLDIGVESFSQDVRFHMGKKFTNEDMWWCFEMLHKYEIGHSLLMIVGYPTETEEDHQQTLETINRLFDLGYATKKNPRTGENLMLLWFANILQLTTDTPLWDKLKDDLTYYEDDIRWEYQGNDVRTRYRRFKEVHDLIQARGGKSCGTWFKRMMRMAEEAAIEESRKRL